MLQTFVSIFFKNKNVSPISHKLLYSFLDALVFLVILF